MIDLTVKETNQLVSQMLDTGKTDKRVLLVAKEINQKYKDYLDDLDTAILEGRLKISAGVDVDLNGQVIHFTNTKDFAEWLSEVGNG